MGKNEKTSKGVGSLASKLLRKPAAATAKQIKSLAASVLTQRPDKKRK